MYVLYIGMQVTSNETSCEKSMLFLTLLYLHVIHLKADFIRAGHCSLQVV
jgi:hypothetical protein